MTQEIINRLKELLTKATAVTEADLIRYEHGGGRWAKLRDGERTLVADFYNEADREAHVAAWLALPALLSTLTNLTPSGVERIRALVREMEELPEDLRLIVALTDDGRKLRAMLESAALPSEPPSQGDVEGLVDAAMKRLFSHYAFIGRVTKSDLHLACQYGVEQALASKEDGRS